MLSFPYRMCSAAVFYRPVFSAEHPSQGTQPQRKVSFNDPGLGVCLKGCGISVCGGAAALLAPHRLMGICLALLVHVTGGDNAVFGLVVGLGGFAEALTPLFGDAWMYRLPIHELLPLSLLLDFARPLLFLAAFCLVRPLLCWGRSCSQLVF